MPFETDATNWSGEGNFTLLLLERLRGVDGIRTVRVEDAPATRSEADYQFIGNELFVGFQTEQRVERFTRFGFIPATRTVTVKRMSLDDLETALAGIGDIGPADYSDDGMIQYLRTERI